VLILADCEEADSSVAAPLRNDKVLLMRSDKTKVTNTGILRGEAAQNDDGLAARSK